jgi:hypothetical protein
MLTLGAGFEDAVQHAHMVLDRVRVEKYAAAIRAVVRPSDVVVDVGSGSGVLALVAARAGARKVYAVEATAAAELIAAHARDNGVASVIEILRGDARDVVFAEPPTVIVTETMGVVGVDEGMLPMLAVVARKCAPGARAIPASLDVRFAPVSLEKFGEQLAALEDVAGLRLSVLRARVRQQVFPVRLAATALCGPSVGTGALVLPTATRPRTLRATLRLERDAPVNGIAAWFRAELAPGIELDTGPLSADTHWGQLLFPIDPPLSCRADDVLELTVDLRSELRRATWAWTVRHGNEERIADALQALCAEDVDDLLRQLGTRRREDQWTPSSRLVKLAQALGGRAEGIDEMAARLQAAAPDRYADREDSRQDVLALLARLD